MEPPAAQLLWHTGEHEHYRALRRMTDAYFADARNGRIDAIERMIDFYGGVGSFAGWPQRVRDYAMQTTKSNLLDWEAAYEFELTPIALGSIDLPARHVWRPESCMQRGYGYRASHAERVRKVDRWRGALHDRPIQRRWPTDRRSVNANDDGCRSSGRRVG